VVDSYVILCILFYGVLRVQFAFWHVLIDGVVSLRVLCGKRTFRRQIPWTFSLYTTQVISSILCRRHASAL